MQSTVSEENLWVTIFIVIMQMEISVAVMQVVYSATHYALDRSTLSFIAIQVTGQITVSYSFL